MEAKSRAFTFLGNEALIRVPFFQRPYVWKKDNWEELLAELSDTHRSHYLGSIILKQQTTATGEPKEALIIDGQQRLTTLSILMKALYDSLPETVQKNVETQIRNCLFFKKDATDEEFFIKIKHSLVDAEAFEEVIRAGLDGYPKLDISKASKSRITQCYAYFMNELTGEGRDRKINSAIFNWLNKPENELLVVIDLALRDDEQAIFDTINSAGVHLSPADIIKNALFQKLIQLEKESTATKFYKQTWGNYLTDDEDAMLFWEKEFVTGRLKRDNLALLLHSVAVIKGIYNPDEHTLADLSRLYKEYIAGLSTSEEVRSLINDIIAYSEIYRHKIPDFDSSTLFTFSEYQNRLFHILENFEITTFHPFILFLYKTFEDNEAELKRMFAALESFVVRRVLSKHEVKSFNKFCREFINTPESLIKRLSESNDADFHAAFKGIKNSQAALILFWIELNRRSQDGKSDKDALKYNYTLEHIMPQKWKEYWKAMPAKMNTDGKAMDTKQTEDDRNAKILWIGNMTLLTTKLNTSLRNYEYTKKMEGEETSKRRKNGIKDYADLYITRHDLVHPYDKGDHEWDEAKIISRTENLIAEIESIWVKVN